MQLFGKGQSVARFAGPRFALPDPWSPLQIPGCRLFCSSQNPNTAWTAIPGLVHATADGNTVASLDDMSASRHRLYAPSAANGALLGSGGGRGTFLAFDGSKEYSIPNSLAAFRFFYTTRVFTLAFWVNPTTNGVAYQLFDQNNGGSGAFAGIWIRRTTGDKLQVFAGDGSGNTIVNATTSASLTTGHNCVIIDADGTNLTTQINGGSVESFVMGAGAAAGTNAHSNLFVGANATSGNRLTGSLDHIFIGDAPMEASDRAKFNAYNPVRKAVPTAFAISTSPILLPSQLNGLWAHWCFDDPQYLWQDTSKTTAVAANSDPIALCENRTGAELLRDMSTSTAGDRPLWKTGVVNGRAAAKLDGVDDNLDFAAFPNGGDLTMMFAARNLDATNGSHFFSDSFYMTCTGSSYVGNADFEGTSYFVTHPLSGNTPQSTLPNPNEAWNIFECIRSGSSLELWVNGRNRGVVSNSDVMTFTKMGDEAIAGWQFDGYMAEIALFNVAHYATRAPLRKYFLAKYGISNVTV